MLFMKFLAVLDFPAPPRVSKVTSALGIPFPGHQGVLLGAVVLATMDGRKGR
jgi:hypothetical protein